MNRNTDNRVLGCLPPTPSPSNAALVHGSTQLPAWQGQTGAGEPGELGCDHLSPRRQLWPTLSLPLCRQPPLLAGDISHRRCASFQ
jgi:hypothetical protein